MTNSSDASETAHAVADMVAAGILETRTRDDGEVEYRMTRFWLSQGQAAIDRHMREWDRKNIRL